MAGNRMNTISVWLTTRHFIRFPLSVLVLFLLASFNSAAQYKINGKIRFLTYNQIQRVYQEENNFATGEYTRTIIPLSQTSIKDAMGNQWRDVAFNEVSPVFQIFSDEYDFSNIPICAHAYDDRYSNLNQQIREALNATPAKDQFEASVTTDKSGSFEVEISNGDFTWVTVSANGGTAKAQTCGSQKNLSVRQDLKGSAYNVYHNDFLHYGDYRSYPVTISLYVTLDGELLDLQKHIDDLIGQIPSSSLSETVRRLDEYTSNNTSFATRFPRSCNAVRDSILSIAQRKLLASADSTYQSKNYERAASLYSDLANLLPSSSSHNLFVSKRERTLQDLANQLVDDSLRTSCDSLIAVANAMPNKSKAIKFLDSKRKTVGESNPYWARVEERIENLKTEIESDKEETELNRQRQADAAALRKFNVDLTVTQLDFFSNPFAFKGKHIALTCIVKKFETPTSAIMEAANSFYADFKVSTPKKFTTLNLIVKVKGVTTVINAFGAPMKVPYVDVVHILNNSPNNY
jgi:hypothetical protein